MGHYQGGHKTDLKCKSDLPLPLPFLSWVFLRSINSMVKWNKRQNGDTHALEMLYYCVSNARYDMDSVPRGSPEMKPYPPLLLEMLYYCVSNARYDMDSVPG